MSKEIRDPIHGEIRVEDDEIGIIDSKDIQRLRRISQLGLSDLVYPAATHTRFIHSLGVMHLSELVSNQLGFSEDEKKEQRIAAILHDSGHGPFSHASEVVSLENGLSHENISCEIVERLENKIPIDSERVKSLIRGEKRNNVISGEIDCDRMDYLKRDAHMSGLEHGDIDIRTIIKSMDLIDGEIIIEKRAAQATANFFTARELMNMSLYSHKASLIAEKMLIQSLRKYVKEFPVRDMMRKDDYQMHSKLMELDEIGYLYRKAVVERDIYKKCAEIDIFNSSKENLKKLNQELDREKTREKVAKEAGVSKKDLIIDLPSIPSEDGISQKIRYKGEVRELTEVVKILSNLEEEKWRKTSLSVYASKDNQEKISKSFKRIFEDYYKN